MASFSIGIVADDLTGSMDTSVVFASRGLRAAVALSPDARLEKDIFGIHCINTQSRFMSQSEAANAVSRAARRLLNTGCARLYKKIDSTLRGHVGAEIAAMMNEANASTAFVCPAFPAMGRTVRRGVAYVRDRPLSETQEGRDVFTGLQSPLLTNLLSKQSGLKSGLIDESVYEHSSGVSKQVSQLIEDGCRLIAFDATREEHLSLILEGTEGWKNESILVGSAGLASTLASSLNETRKYTRNSSLSKLPSQPIILVSGSLNAVTQTQLQALHKIQGLDHILINAPKILGTESSMRMETQRVIQKASAAIEEKRDACIYWSNPDELETVILAEQNASWMIERISAAIDSVVTAITSETNIGGMILVGGETAYAVLTALKADAIELHSQVVDGVPFGTVMGGLADKKLVVTKAGGFGNEATLVDSFNFARRLGDS